MENKIQKKYTLAKYSNLNITKVITGNFNNYEELFKSSSIDNNSYFVLKEEIRDEHVIGGWRIILDRTFVLKEI